MRLHAFGTCTPARPSIVRVTNLENNRQKVLIINDRGPFYNGCEGNNVTLVAGLLDIHQRGSAALSERIQIGQTLGANKVELKLQVPVTPFDRESHKIVIVMTAQKKGNSARLISEKRFEYRPRRSERSNKLNDYQSRRNKKNGEEYGTHGQHNAMAIKSKRPDLCIVNVRQFPPNVVPKSKNVFFEILVGNKGEGACRSAIRVSGPDGVQRSIDPLGPGQSQTVRLPLIFRASGPGRTTIDSIYFQVDPNNHIPESNERNNAAGPFTVVMN